MNALVSALQNERLVKLRFPYEDGPAAGLMVEHMEATEHASRDFALTLSLFSEDAAIELKSLLGKVVTVELERDDGLPRFFNGHVFAFRLTKSDNGFSFYEAEVGPWTRYLTHRHDNYVFQNQSCIDTLREIFADYGALPRVQFKVRGGDQPETYRVQWDESDYNYLHRRIEEKGWWYYFEHTTDSHTLVICDDSTTAAPVDGNAEIEFQGGNMVAQQDSISQWSPARELVPGSVALSSYDFKKPNIPPNGEAESRLEQGDVPSLEVYKFAGAYGFADSSAATDAAHAQIEAHAAMAKRFEGKGDCRQFQPGRAFKLLGHFDHGRDDPSEAQFFLASVEHTARNNYFSDDGQPTPDGQTVYGNTFKAIRKTIPYRVAIGHNSSLSKIYGIQTATVVGPAGEEIHCDAFGRVKVQFHWDRHGKRDDNACCWVRVATTWAGSNFGVISLPRIGQEVVVQWVNGNPDTPLITGSVFNQDNMPPWGLPDNKTQSGILTRSTLGGSEANANALRFEDKKGKEEVWLHAEKDQRIEVEHDESHWVGHDRTKTIDNDETTHVKRDRTETVDNNETITVHGERKERVDHNETISIGDNRAEDVGGNETLDVKGNRSETIHGMQSLVVKLASNEAVGLAKAVEIGLAYSVNVGAGMNTIVGLVSAEEVGQSKTVVVGNTYNIKVVKQYTLDVGASHLSMDSDGNIVIKGKNILLDASGGPIVLLGKDVDVNP